jgi:predicted acetyltransferase
MCDTLSLHDALPIWTIAPEARGRGYGKKMVCQALLLPVAKGQKILAQIKKENVASQKIAESAGFVLDFEDEDGNQKWFK